MILPVGCYKKSNLTHLPSGSSVTEGGFARRVLQAYQHSINVCFVRRVLQVGEGATRLRERSVAEGDFARRVLQAAQPPQQGTTFHIVAVGEFARRASWKGGKKTLSMLDLTATQLLYMAYAKKATVGDIDDYDFCEEGICRFCGGRVETVGKGYYRLFNSNNWNGQSWVVASDKDIICQGCMFVWSNGRNFKSLLGGEKNLGIVANVDGITLLQSRDQALETIFNPPAPPYVLAYTGGQSAKMVKRNFLLYSVVGYTFNPVRMLYGLLPVVIYREDLESYLAELKAVQNSAQFKQLAKQRGDDLMFNLALTLNTREETDNNVR